MFHVKHRKEYSMMIFTITDILWLIVMGLLFAIWVGIMLSLIIHSIYERIKESFNNRKE